MFSYMLIRVLSSIANIVYSMESVHNDVIHFEMNYIFKILFIVTAELMTILWNPLYLKPKNKQNDLFKILGHKTLWYLFKYFCIYFLPDKNSITLHMLLKFLFCFHHRFNGILSAFPSPKITSCLVLWFPSTLQMRLYFA